MIYAKLGEQVPARNHLEQTQGIESNFHPVYAGVAKDTLKKAVSQS